jgi:hypothetical protein
LKRFEDFQNEKPENSNNAAKKKKTLPASERALVIYFKEIRF